MSNVENQDLSHLRGLAVAANVNAKRVFDLIDATSSQDVTALEELKERLRSQFTYSGADETDKLMLLVKSLRTVYQAAAECLEMLGHEA
jgi:hypothetical protein